MGFFIFFPDGAADTHTLNINTAINTQRNFILGIHAFSFLENVSSRPSMAPYELAERFLSSDDHMQTDIA
jgi:hypothetical protein